MCKFLFFFLPPGLWQSFWNSQERQEWWMEPGFIILLGWGPMASLQGHYAPIMVSPPVCARLSVWVCMQSTLTAELCHKWTPARPNKRGPMEVVVFLSLSANNLTDANATVLNSWDSEDFNSIWEHFQHTHTLQTHYMHIYSTSPFPLYPLIVTHLYTHTAGLTLHWTQAHVSSMDREEQGQTGHI